MQSNRARVLVVVMVLAVASGALALAFRDAIQWAWWDRNASQALTEVQLDKLSACEDPGWQAMQRVLVQDMDVDCAPEQVVGWLADRTIERRVPWVRWQAEEASLPARSRARASLALLVRHGTEVEGLTWLLDEPGVGEPLRSWVLEAVATDELPGTWLDPRWQREHQRRTFLAAELDGWPEAVRVIGEQRFWPSTAGAEVAALAAADRLGRSGCGATDGACLDALARALRDEAMESSSIHDGVRIEPRTPSNDALTPLWEALHADPVANELGASALAEAAAWTASDPGRAAARIVATVSGGAHVDGAAGDPMWALRHRSATPWATVAAATALADSAGLQVRAGAWLDGVALEVGGQAAVGVGPQGELLELPGPDPETGDPPELPLAAVTLEDALVAAAEEAFAPALERGELRRARRLAMLVFRSDEARGAVLLERLPAPSLTTPEARLGDRLGGLLR